MTAQAERVLRRLLIAARADVHFDFSSDDPNTRMLLITQRNAEVQLEGDDQDFVMGVFGYIRTDVGWRLA